jgi:hypothetical protein
MRISSRVRFLAPAGAVLLGVIMIGAQVPSAWAADAAGKAAKVAKPPSVCVGLDESACGGKTECYWRKASLTKTGKSRRAHCRIKRSAIKSDPA